MNEAGTKACLVISHYNAWETNQLIKLLDQAREIPAGVPFHTRVVVNKAVEKVLILPERHADVEIHYRRNTGYNIGAWDLGWRVGEVFPFYLFLQEECLILQAGWMKAFLDVFEDPRVGLVGESLSGGTAWQQERERPAGYPICTWLGFPPIPPAAYVDRVKEVARSMGIDPGETDRHLQSLVLATTRGVLERINGFRSETVDYLDAMCSEVLISRAVAAAGLEFRQVAEAKFSVIAHPQWTGGDSAPGVRGIASRIVPDDLSRATEIVKGALLARARRLGNRLGRDRQKSKKE